jgi:hypothetical protein
MYIITVRIRTKPRTNTKQQRNSKTSNFTFINSSLLTCSLKIKCQPITAKPTTATTIANLLVVNSLLAINL